MQVILRSYRNLPNKQYEKPKGGFMARRPIEEDEDQQPQKKGIDFKALLPKILKFGFLAINFVVMVGGAFTVYNIKIAYRRPAMTEESETVALDKERADKDTKSVMLTMDPFVANLAGSPKKVLRTTIHLEMLNEQGFEEAMDLGPKARDQIMKTLSGMNYSDIETIQGKLFLKNEIIKELNELMRVGTVKDIYFGEFVVQ